VRAQSHRHEDEHPRIKTAAPSSSPHQIVVLSVPTCNATRTKPGGCRPPTIQHTRRLQKQRRCRSRSRAEQRRSRHWRRDEHMEICHTIRSREIVPIQHLGEALLCWRMPRCRCEFILPVIVLRRLLLLGSRHGDSHSTWRTTTQQPLPTQPTDSLESWLTHARQSRDPPLSRDNERVALAQRAVVYPVYLLEKHVCNNLMSLNGRRRKRVGGRKKGAVPGKDPGLWPVSARPRGGEGEDIQKEQGKSIFAML
jgi:hypothetical protein